MSESSCGQTIPRACAESFADITGRLGEIKAIAQATHEQASRTNGRVAELFEQTASQASALARLGAEVTHLQVHQAEQEGLTRRVLSAGWRVALILAGAVASLLGLKHLVQ